MSKKTKVSYDPVTEEIVKGSLRIKVAEIASMMKGSDYEICRRGEDEDELSPETRGPHDTPPLKH